MRIGLLGQFGSGNAGNDGSLAAMIAFLRRTRPDAELTCICTNPATIAREHGIRAVGISPRSPAEGFGAVLNRIFRNAPHRAASLWQALAATRGLDLVIVPGTGILDDFQDRPSGWPYVLFRWSLAARLAGAKLAFVSVGAGPITHPASRLLLKSAARLATYRSYRDMQSWEFMAGLGLDVSDDPVFPDIAFGLPTPADERSLSTAEPPVIGFGVMAYHGWKKGMPDAPRVYDLYLARITDALTRLMAGGARIRMLTGDAADRLAVVGILDRLPARLREAVVIAPCPTLDALMREIARTDIVVGTRYHNIVCALAMGRPALSLGYSVKNDAVMADFDLSDFCRPVEDFEPAWVAEKANALLEGRAHLAPQVARQAARQRERLALQERHLADTLLARTEPALAMVRSRA